SDDNEGTRWNAAEALGRLGDPRAVEPLIDTLWDDDARVRLKAVWALGMLGIPGHWVPPAETLPDRAGGCEGDHPGSDGDDQTGDGRQSQMNVCASGPSGGGTARSWGYGGEAPIL